MNKKELMINNMKYYKCKDYGLVYQRGTPMQYHACKKVLESDGEYSDCIKDKCPLMTK